MKYNFYEKFKQQNPPMHYNEVLSALDDLTELYPTALELEKVIRELIKNKKDAIAIQANQRRKD